MESSFENPKTLSNWDAVLPSAPSYIMAKTVRMPSGEKKIFLFWFGSIRLYISIASMLFASLIVALLLNCGVISLIVALLSNCGIASCVGEILVV